MASVATPPNEITLVYRPLGRNSHVFTADGWDMRGLHISSPDLKMAFERAAEGLSEYVSALYSIDAQYEIQCSFAEFKEHLSSENRRANLVIARNIRR